MRVGLIGAGFIGRMHAKLSKQVPDIDLIGYVDPYPKSDHADLRGLRRIASTEALLQDKPDGVIVAVPDELHVATAVQCLLAGSAVLLEKPAARSLDEGIVLSRAPDVEARLLVAHQRRHHPASQVTKGLISDGRLGRLIGVGGVFAVSKEPNYFVERPRGVGLVNLIHDLDLLQYYCGRFTMIGAEVSHVARGAKEEDTIALTMRFDTGVVGSFVATDSAPSPWGWDQATHELPSIPFTAHGTTYSLLGTKGSLSIPDLKFYSHGAGEAWHHPLQQQTLSASGGNAYVNQLSHFVDVMRGKARPLVGINDALSTQAALEAVFISAREGQRVDTIALIEAARARA